MQQVPTTFSNMTITAADPVTRYNLGYGKGYNDGFNQAVTKFNTIIIALFTTMLLQIFVHRLLRSNHDLLDHELTTIQWRGNDVTITHRTILKRVENMLFTIQFTLITFLTVVNFLPVINITAQ